MSSTLVMSFSTTSIPAKEEAALRAGSGGLIRASLMMQGSLEEDQEKFQGRTGATIVTPHMVKAEEPWWKGTMEITGNPKRIQIHTIISLIGARVSQASDRRIILAAMHLTLAI